MNEDCDESELKAFLDADLSRMEQLARGIRRWEKFRWMLVCLYGVLVLALTLLSYKLYELTRDSLAMLNQIPGGAATIIGIGVGQGIGLGFLYHHCVSQLFKGLHLDPSDQKRKLLYYYTCRSLLEGQKKTVVTSHDETTAEYPK